MYNNNIANVANCGFSFMEFYACTVVVPYIWGCVHNNKIEQQGE